MSWQILSMDNSTKYDDIDETKAEIQYKMRIFWGKLEGQTFTESKTSDFIAIYIVKNRNTKTHFSFPKCTFYTT